MNTFRAVLVTSALVWLLGVPAASQAQMYERVSASGGRILTGELVVLNGTTNQFRLVGNGGTFRAPGGMSVVELDGKPVQVELSSAGQVLQITETPINVDPRQHHYEIVSGQLVVNDAASGTFTIAGDNRTYIAPRGIDVQPYAGRQVEVFLDEQGQVKRLEFARRGEMPPAPVGVAPYSGVAPAVRTCAFEGQGYSDGATVCQSGSQFRCESGTWRTLGTACGQLGTATSCTAAGVLYASGARNCIRGAEYMCDRGQWRSLGACSMDTAGVVPPGPRSCNLGGATIANGGSICREGTTFRCDNGDWTNVQIACR